MDWISTERNLNNNNQATISEKDIKNQNKNQNKKNNKFRLISPSFTLINEPSINDFLEAFQLLKEGKFISSDSSFDNFKNIFSKNDSFIRFN